MKITLQNTDCMVTLEIDGHDVPARLWEGTSEAGVQVIAFITRISPQTHAPDVVAVFERELQKTRRPELRVANLRLIL